MESEKTKLNDRVCNSCGYTPRDYGFEDDAKPWTHWACPDHYGPGGYCEGVLIKPEDNAEEK